MTRLPYPHLVAEIRALRLQWRKSDDSYHAEPFALTSRLNDTEGAKKRMRKVRARKAAA